MKRLSWRKQPRVTRELASRLDGTPRRRRRGTNGLTRALRGPEPLERRCLLATFVVNQVGDAADTHHMRSTTSASCAGSRPMHRPTT